ncbi:MAG: NAD(P)H-dependent glycerol-3-phosphate dehydrogenase [Chloroflexota bacterium]|nr:NAD(P)H-dependent glycerol-3-phosphate dehydrogenase [Chloroflexota bacterium]
MKVAIVGSTSWGTTMGMLLARKGAEVHLWTRTAEEAQRLAREGENATRLPGIPLPQGLVPTSDLKGAIAGAALVIVAVPSQTMRGNVRQVCPHLEGPVPLMCASKGLESGTAQRMSVVIAEELGAAYQDHICVLSGPNLSREIALGLPASTVVAAADISLAQGVADIMASPTFHVYTSDDVVGVELGGALKNIIALGAGMADGLNYGMNAKAAFMSQGLTEITRLGVAAGAKPITFIGLSCLGDLLATCSSPLSRNHTLGEGLAMGRSLEEQMALMGSVVEGVATTAAAIAMARRLGVEMPITERIYRVLYEGADIRDEMSWLMKR